MPVTVMMRAVGTAWRRSVAIPGGIVVAAGFYLMVTTVLSGLWSTAAGASGGQIAGYSAVALVWYIATAESAVSSVPIRMIEEIGDAISSRRVEQEMLRPASVLGVRVATEVGAVLPRLTVNTILGFAFALVVGGSPASWIGLVIAAPALLLAVTLNIVIQHAFAGAAFWVDETKSSWFLYQKLVFILGGMLLPLEVLPRWLEVVAKLLPFAAVAYVPARLAAGHVEPLWILVQLFWLVVAVAVASKVFAAGQRRLLTVGS